MEKILLLFAIIAATGCRGVPPDASQGPPQTLPETTASLQNNADRLLLLQTILQSSGPDPAAVEPSLLAGKIARMKLKSHDYLRGNLEIAWQDFSKNDISQALPAKDNIGIPPKILLVGDPHIENIGAYMRSDSTLALAFNDFDATRAGDFRFDLLRLAVSFELLGRTSELKDKARKNVLNALIEGYTEQVNAQAERGHPPVDIEENKVIAKTCLICEDLLSRARRDGDSNKILSKYTRLRDESRVLLDQEFKPDMLTPEVIDDDLEPISETELSRLTNALQHYPQTLTKALEPTDPQLKVKGIARLLGKGVSSYALLRYVALIEGPTASPIDDLLLDIKAVPTTPQAPCPAQHVVEAQRALQGPPTHDPWLGWTCHNQRAFLIQSLSGYQKSARVDRISEKLSKDKWDTKDLKAFAAAAGRLLASAHLRSQTPPGAPAAPLISAYLRQHPLDTLADAATKTADTTEADWRLLSSLPPPTP